ncbi:MAG: division/cell wall cluster transcriptional repressor MraZ [Phycisphaerales bacterium]
MVFTGQSELSIDAKQRLAIPAKYRNQWNPQRDGGAWVCVPWDRTLRLYTEGLFSRLADAFPSTLAPDGNVAEFDRQFFGSAERLEVDSAGRLTIPKRHLDFARLGSDVMMVGARDRLEVHDLKEWSMFAPGKHAGLPQLVENMSKLGQIPVIHAGATDSAPAGQPRDHAPGGGGERETTTDG